MFSVLVWYVRGLDLSAHSSQELTLRLGSVEDRWVATVRYPSLLQELLYTSPTISVEKASYLCRLSSGNISVFKNVYQEIPIVFDEECMKDLAAKGNVSDVSWMLNLPTMSSREESSEPLFTGATSSGNLRPSRRCVG